MVKDLHEELHKARKAAQLLKEAAEAEKHVFHTPQTITLDQYQSAD